MATSKRLYQVWKGNNGLLLSIFLITSPVVVFCTQVATKIIQRAPSLGIPLLVVAAFFTILDLLVLIMTSGRDPGIVPRNTQSPENEEGYDSATPSMEWVNARTTNLRLPLTKDTTVNGVTVKRNYRFFFMFISSTTLLFIYVFTFSWVNILQQRSHSGLWKVMAKEIPSVALIVYCFLAIRFVGGLTFFHLFLISTNQHKSGETSFLGDSKAYGTQKSVSMSLTTYENFRSRYDKRENPYYLEAFKNFKEIFFSPIPPSLNDFRSMMIEEPVETANVSPTKKSDAITSDVNIDIELGKVKSGFVGDLGLPVILQGLEYDGINDKLKTRLTQSDDSLDLFDLPLVERTQDDNGKDETSTSDDLHAINIQYDKR